MDYILNNKDEILNRILSNCEKVGDCLVHKSHQCKHGYTRIGINYRRYLTHRIILILNTEIGFDYGKLLALHTPVICHNTSCCNIEHLRWGTNSENMKDRILDCTDNSGRKHGMSKLKESEVIDIFNATETLTDLSLKYNVTFQHISHIKNAKGWKHLNISKPYKKPKSHWFIDSMSERQIFDKKNYLIKRHKIIMQNIVQEIIKQLN